ALCVDGKGRLWAGTNRHGVCVYNGKKWAHYGILNGPIGCHIYAMAYDRYANQVWMATENGISVYQCAGGQNGGAGVPARINSLPHYAAHTWHYITGINGLPANPDAIGFDSAGTAFVGTQCNGLVVATPTAKKYYSSNINNPFAIHTIQYKLRIITAPWNLPRTAGGFGLPSNLVNSVMVTRENHIYVGTDLGLAVSLNDGETFRYERGADYAAKVQGSCHAPAGFYPPPKAVLNRLLPGDHITSVTQDCMGHLWLGTWRNGYEVLNPINGQCYKSENDPTLRNTDGYISELCPVTVADKGSRRANAAGDSRGPSLIGTAQQIMFIGRYGFGVSAFPKGIVPVKLGGGHTGRTLALADPVAASRHTPALPVPAGTPSADALSRLNANVTRFAFARTTEGVVPYALPSDWRTEGNWIDCYGTFADVCATMNGDGCDQAGGYHESQFAYRSWVGPAGGPKDYLRYWVEWVQTDQNRVLQDLWRGGRKESEWDDHGETYSNVQSGLGVYCTMHLPAGVFEISTYSVNKDGHYGPNRNRDYSVSLCRTPISQPLFMALGKQYVAARVLWRRIQRTDAIAWTRVDNFWWGEYARFVIRQTQPGYITLAVRRNWSASCAITCGVFINRLNGPAGADGVVLLSRAAGNPADWVLNPAHAASKPKGRVTQTTRDAVNLVNNILAFRSRHPVAYMRDAAALDIAVLRYFVRSDGGKGIRARALGGPTNGRGFMGLRSALALLARDAGQFRIADEIHPPRQLFESYCWQDRTQSGLGKKWQWSRKGYEEYLRKIRRQTIALR
ncbi:MAG: hypothetical protein ACP5I8_13570, partial [Phycisphaerae bacterium]